MRKIILMLVLVNCYLTNAFSQERIDSTSIAFKAKLFTVSEYGISNESEILKDIQSQKIIFLKTKYEHFLFMKISFSQPYRLPNKHTQTLYRDCNYYLAFNIEDSRFYKLGGFDILDIDSFFEDLQLREDSIFKDIEEGKEIDEIDIYCLYDYYKMKKRKRVKKGFNCLDNCAKKTETSIILH